MDDLDSEEQYGVDSEEESEEEREVVQEAPVVNEEREEVKSIVFYRSPRASPLVRGLARVMVGQV